MNKNFLNDIRNILILEKQHLLDKSTITVDIDSDGDDVDKIQAKLIVQLDKNLKLREKEKIQSISFVLNKIDEGVYGKCEDCQDEISEKRLLINPCFLTCIDCAQDREILAKQKRKC